MDGAVAVCRYDKSDATIVGYANITEIMREWDAVYVHRALADSLTKQTISAEYGERIIEITGMLPPDARVQVVEIPVETAEQTGYGVVAPAEADLKLEEPAIIRQGSRFGVRLCASAPSLHILRADVSTTVSPIHET